VTTQLDEARTIARGLLRLVEQLSAQHAERVTRACTDQGITWLAPRMDLLDDEWLTRDQVAELGGVTAQAVSQWCSRGIPRGGQMVKLTRHPEGYSKREVMDFLELLRRSPDRPPATPDVQEPTP
jgi:hypothetical protein